MCGFSMIISRSADKMPEVNKMNGAMVHRGPDHEGYFEGDHIAMGHRRLSIIDLSEASNQPMLNRRGDLVLIYNGEIYNYKELRDSLDYSFCSNGDTEIILALYELYGEKLVEKLDGIFSFCLYDVKKNSVLIARDRMGQKPLYYYLGNDFLLVSSELRPLLKTSFFEAKIDLRSFHEYFRYKTVYTPNTIIEGVKSHLPACYSLISLDKIVNAEYSSQDMISEKPYWNIEHSIYAGQEFNFESTRKKVKELFMSSVEKRLMSDVNLGVFLSGGIDSTAIVGAASALSNSQINTFSIDFKEEGYSEKKYADLVAEHFSTKHYTLSIDKDYFSSNFFEGLNAMDHPGEDGLNNYFISKYAKEKGISVGLSGVGGDELYAGYYVFDVLKKLRSNADLWNLPGFVKRIIIAYRDQFKPGEISGILSETLLNSQFSLSDIYPLFRSAFRNDELNFLPFSGSLTTFSKTDYSEDHFISSISVNEMTYYMQNILLRDADVMSMASSLELRAPFLDKDLVEYSLAMPDNIKGYNKRILTDSLKEFIPDEIVKRSKKGFVIPIQKWITNDMDEWLNQKIIALFKREELSIADHLEIFLKSPEVNADRYQKLWHLAVLEHWISINMDENE